MSGSCPFAQDCMRSWSPPSHGGYFYLVHLFRCSGFSIQIIVKRTVKRFELKTVSRNACNNNLPVIIACVAQL